MTLPNEASIYTSPRYLRSPLREYFATNDKGIYWLQASRGLGKTQLVRGVIERQVSAKDNTTKEGIDSNLSSDVRSIGFYIRSDRKDGPRQFVEALHANIDEEMQLSDEERAGVVPGIRYGDAAEARAGFVAWLSKLQKILASKGGKRLLVCVDALDAMAEPGSGAFNEPFSILDILPAVTEVPTNVVFLVTSRLPAECPAGLAERIAAKFGKGSGYVARQVDLNDKEYAELLLKYFRDRLQPYFRKRIVDYWTPILKDKLKFEKGGRDDRLTKDPGLRDGLKVDWKNLTNKFPRYSGQPVPVASILHILDEIDKLWNDMLEKSEMRFRGIDLVIARLLDGTLPMEQVAGLPKGDELVSRLEGMKAPAAA
ncbi:MAG: hypothetical protein J2P53_03680 [Bradyrhizobiaceae bacterium]|nr:hypothetical protein [Bradyrhizobiaceae bacterium]